MICWLFHRRYWHITYRNAFGGTKTCALCGRRHHYGTL